MTTLGELSARGVLTFNDGYRTKRQEHAQSGFRILRAGDVRDGEIQPNGPDFVAHHYASAIGEKVARTGDVVLTTKGTVGRVAYVNRIDQPVVYSPQVCYFRSRDEDVLHQPFLRYWLQGSEFTGQSGYLMGASDMAPYISLRDLAQTAITLPEVAEQRCIADVLGALDDKIAANRRLRSSADAVCSAWFAVLADGSNEATLGAVADINRSSVRVGATKDLRYLDISSVGVGDYDWPASIDWEQAPGRARRSLAFGDTVWSTVRPGRRSHALVLDDDPELIGSTGLAVLTPSNAGPAFVYEATRTEAFTAFLESVAEGSAYPAVRADKFALAPIPDVSPSERQVFESKAMPVRLRVHAATVESRHLANLRDTLLPHLMSGRLTVRQAETLVDKVL